MIINSCTISKKTNFIFEGSFVCQKEDATYYLEVKEIDKETYLLSNGINVVHDVVNKDKYYMLSFYWMIESKKETYNFVNLKDSHPKTNAIPVFYDDDNKNRFIPQSKDSKNKYTIVFNNVYLELEDV